MDVKSEVLLQLLNKSKTFQKPKFFSIVKFKKPGFSAPLKMII